MSADTEATKRPWVYPEQCVCGEPVTTRVRVVWANGPSTYRYCLDCAADVVDTIEGAEVLP